MATGAAQQFLHSFNFALFIERKEHPSFLPLALAAVLGLVSEV